MSEPPQSTAKRGWIKRSPLEHNPEDRTGPDAAGATRRRRGRPRCGWGHSIPLRFSSEMSERAGRRPALAFRSSSPGRAVPIPEVTPFAATGLTASIPTALGVGAAGSSSSLRPFSHGSDKRPRRRSRHGLQVGIVSDALTALGVGAAGSSSSLRPFKASMPLGRPLRSSGPARPLPPRGQPGRSAGRCTPPRSSPASVGAARPTAGAAPRAAATPG